MKPVDICQSSYDHVPYKHFADKEFYKKHNSTDILCSECLRAWKTDCSRILAREILRKAVLIWKSHKNIFYDRNFELTPGENVDYKIPGNHHKEKHEDFVIPGVKKHHDHDLYPVVVPDVTFTDEELKATPEIYESQTYSTNMKVVLPEYMKYILCSYAEINISTFGYMMKSHKICDARITFNGPCSNGSNSSKNSDCGCTSSSQEWIPVSEMLKPIPPLHQFSLEIYPRDLVNPVFLESRIWSYVNLCINTTFDHIPKDIVKALMEDSLHDRYHENITPDDTVYTCSNCNKTSKHTQFYYYQKGIYCLDCMYKIVVEAAVHANLAEEVGLATARDVYSLEILYRDTDVWKRVIIDRYINAMKEAGACPEIEPINPKPFV